MHNTVLDEIDQRFRAEPLLFLGFYRGLINAGEGGTESEVWDEIGCESRSTNTTVGTQTGQISNNPSVIHLSPESVGPKKASLSRVQQTR